MCIKLWPGDPPAHAQHFDAGTDGEDGKLRELVISYLSPPFSTLLVLARHVPTALRGAGPAARHAIRANFWCRMKRCFSNCSMCANQVVLRGLRACSVYCLTLHEQMLRWEGPASAYARELDGSGRLCCVARALVAMEWIEELLWRIARVRWAVIDSMQLHPSSQ